MSVQITIFTTTPGAFHSSSCVLLVEYTSCFICLYSTCTHPTTSRSVGSFHNVTTGSFLTKRQQIVPIINCSSSIAAYHEKLAPTNRLIPTSFASRLPCVSPVGAGPMTALLTTRGRQQLQAVFGRRQSPATLLVVSQLRAAMIPCSHQLTAQSHKPDTSTYAPTPPASP
jgi:hypothetical protein